jgi:xanthine dehydrogenase YagS FAD-binding subunit
MNPFTYIALTHGGQPFDGAVAHANSAMIAGGTNLLDNMKLGVMTPELLIDINALPLDKIEARPDGGLRLGAMSRNTDVAYHETVVRNYPVLSQAILSGASAQLRNMASTGGNLMQRTRCYYYRDTTYPCNQREPGSGCSAIDGFNRIHAVLGTSEKCIATHPSDMCVALAALDATVRVRGAAGNERSIPFTDFHVSYGDDPARQTLLAQNELITAVDLPAIAFAKRSHYLKVRDRASYEFALASAAVILDLDGGTIKSARVALGGVATKPWRAREAEKVLTGAKANDDTFAKAADAELAAAKPQKFNAFKIELCKRTMVRALQTVSAMA